MNDHCVTIHFNTEEGAEAYFKKFRGVKDAKLLSKSNPAKEITALKDREKKLVEAVINLLTGVEHAIDLEYLGEGSTNKMNVDFVKRAREVLKELGVE